MLVSDRKLPVIGTFVPFRSIRIVNGLFEAELKNIESVFNSAVISCASFPCFAAPNGPSTFEYMVLEEQVFEVQVLSYKYFQRTCALVDNWCSNHCRSFEDASGSGILLDKS